MKDKDDGFRQLFHTPAELSTYWTDWAQHIHDDPGIPWGIPSVDKYVIPMRPGDLVGLIARPGHGKSSLMAYHALQEAQRIMARGQQEKEVVVYVTWESSAEEIENFWAARGEYSATDVAWGRVPMDQVKRDAIKRAKVPIWTIGHAIAKAGQPMPRMTLPAVLGAIESMEADFHVKPKLLLFDYIQLIPIAGQQDRQRQVTEAPSQLKELVLRVGAPAVFGVQASRDVDSRKYKIPEMQDSQWGSSIEQAADKLFGLWRPYRTEGPGADPIPMNDGTPVPVTEELMIMRMLKQRGDAGRKTWAMYFAPQFLRLAEMETRYDDPQF